MPDKNAGTIALEYFSTRLNCAESTLLGVMQACGLQCDCAPRIATGFGGGIGGCGEICGALTGAVMAFGLKYGRESGDDLESKLATAKKVDMLIDAFKDKFGTVLCVELTECVMRTPEGRQKAIDLNLHNGLCRIFVEFAANKAAQLIVQNTQ